jgi:hypothetical protein
LRNKSLLAFSLFANVDRGRLFQPTPNLKREKSGLVGDQRAGSDATGTDLRGSNAPLSSAGRTCY